MSLDGPQRDFGAGRLAQQLDTLKRHLSDVERERDRYKKALEAIVDLDPAFPKIDCGDVMAEMAKAALA